MSVQLTITVKKDDIYLDNSFICEIVLPQTLRDLFEYVKDYFYVNGEINNWTCYSVEQQGYYESLDYNFGDLPNEQIIINVSDTAKINRDINQSKIEFQNKKSSYCPYHQNCLIQFICTNQHQCQRKICAQCQQDGIHYSLPDSNFLPIKKFIEELRSYANKALENKQSCQMFEESNKRIFSNLQETIKRYQSDFEDAFQILNNSYETASNLLEYLKQYELQENSNTFLEELISIYQSKMWISNMDQVNLKTIEEHMKRITYWVNYFENNLKASHLSIIPQNQWYYVFQKISQIDPINKQILYEGLNLWQGDPQTPYYGKYLISNFFTIQVFENLYMIGSCLFQIPPCTTLRNIGQMIKDIFNLPGNAESWVYASQSMNKYLTDFDQAPYRFVSSDIINVEIAAFIDLQINIDYQGELKVVRSTFSLQCKIKDLEQAVLEQNGISKQIYLLQSNQNDLLVFITICDIPYRNDNKRDKTLYQLQIKSDTPIQATIKANDVIYRKQRSKIQLHFEIKDGRKLIKFSQFFLVNETYKQVRSAILEYCGLSNMNCKIETDLENSYSFQVQNEMTFNRLQINNNTMITGKIEVF